MRKLLIFLLLSPCFAQLTTTNNGWNTQATGSNVGTWGTFLNANWQSLDNQSPVFVGTVLHPTIASAIAALPSTGGTIRMPPHYRETVTSTIQLGSATQPVKMICDTDDQITFNITDGTSWGMVAHNGTAIFGPDNSATDSCLFLEAGTFNGAGLMTNGEQTENQAFHFAKGVSFRGAGTDTVALVSLIALAGDAAWDHVHLYNFTGIGLQIASGPNALYGFSVFACLDCAINGTGTGNSQPLQVRANLAAIESIQFFGGQIQFPGPAQYAIDMNGNGIAGNGTVLLAGVRTEQFVGNAATQSKAMIRARDFSGVQLTNVSCDLQNSMYCLEVSQGTGTTDDVVVTAMKLNSGGPNAINNLINGDTLTGSVPIYTYAAASTLGQIGGIQFAGNGNVTILNGNDSTELIKLDSGATTGESLRLGFSDQGTCKFFFQKDASNNLQLFQASAADCSAGSQVLQVLTGGTVDLNSIGANPIRLNRSNASGTGVNFYNGGSSTVAAIDQTGQIAQAGVAFASLGTPAVGATQFCTNCVATTPASCSTATPASCVCAAGTGSMWAKRENFQNNGTNWYCH
jgi:hypothetical protein